MVTRAATTPFAGPPTGGARAINGRGLRAARPSPDRVATIVKVAHVRLCHSRMLFARAYPGGAQPLFRTVTAVDVNNIGRHQDEARHSRRARDLPYAEVDGYLVDSQRAPARDRATSPGLRARVIGFPRRFRSLGRRRRLFTNPLRSSRQPTRAPASPGAGAATVLTRRRKEMRRSHRGHSTADRDRSGSASECPRASRTDH